MQIALFVIGVAGFGRPVSWSDDSVIPPGHTIPFKEAIQLVSRDLHIKILVPPWMLKIVPRWRRMSNAFTEVEVSYLIAFTSGTRRS